MSTTTTTSQLQDTQIDVKLVLSALGSAVATVLFPVLAIGALGIIGDGGRDDRIYAAVLAVLLIGTVVDILGINAMYVALFCLSAWLFRRAAEQNAFVAADGRT